MGIHQAIAATSTYGGFLKWRNPKTMGCNTKTGLSLDYVGVTPMTLEIPYSSMQVNRYILSSILMGTPVPALPARAKK